MAEYHPLRESDGHNDESDPQRPGDQADWRANVATLSKKLGDQMNFVGGKIAEQVGVVGDRVKEMFHQPSLGERLVDEATSDVLIGPDWDKNLQICDLVNAGRVSQADVVLGVKRRLALRNGHVQLLALHVLESVLKNCPNVFPEVASEKVLDSMVRIVDDPASPVALREKCLKLLEAWGEAAEELRFLPVFEETYKSLKHRGIVFPPRDPESLAPIFTPPATAAASGAAPGASAFAAAPVDFAAPSGGFVHGGPGGFSLPGMQQLQAPESPALVLDPQEILSVARNSTELLSTVLTSAPPEEVLKDEITLSLAAQCRASKMSLLRLVEGEAENETLLFEALTVNDELDKVLEKLAQMHKDAGPAPAPAPAAAVAAAPSEGQAAIDFLAPPPPVAAFAVPSGEVEDGGEALLRRRGGAGEGEAVGGGSAWTKPGGSSGGAVASAAAPTASEDERALAELDAMVFGKPAPAAPAQQSSGQGGKGRDKEDDLIVF